MMKQLIDRGYQNILLDSAIKRARQISRKVALRRVNRQKKTKGPIFAHTYNPRRNSEVCRLYIVCIIVNKVSFIQKNTFWRNDTFYHNAFCVESSLGFEKTDGKKTIWMKNAC